MRISGTLAGLALGVMTGLAVVGVWQTNVAASADRASPSQAYAALAAAAESGDSRAAALKHDIDRYLAEKGQTVSDLGRVVRSRTEEEVGIQRFSVRGAPPWTIQVSNVTRFQSDEDFSAYRALREGAMHALVNADDTRTVEVVITPNGLEEVADFSAALNCACAVKQATMDVFVGDAWLYQVGADFSDLDFGSSAQLVDDTLREEAASALDMFTGLTRDDLKLTVHSIRLTASARDASQLADRVGVLLVDPITDTLDLFGPRAASVAVINTADVFEWHAENILGLQLAPTTIVPTPKEGR